MENKVYKTKLGDVRVIRIERDMVTVIYKDKMSNMHVDFLKALIAESAQAEKQQKYNLILKHDKANAVFLDMFRSSDCCYTWDEATDIAFAYALYLEGK